MPSAPQPANLVYFDVSEREIDEALAACKGDVRATIRALLIGQAWLEGGFRAPALDPPSAIPVAEIWSAHPDAQAR